MSSPRAIKRLERWFEPAVRQRGDRYWREGRVDVVAGRGAREAAGELHLAEVVRGVVEGAIPYDVWVEPAGRVLWVSCSCPHFQDQLMFCKHLWATLRWIEELEPWMIEEAEDLEALDDELDAGPLLRAGSGGEPLVADRAMGRPEAAELRQANHVPAWRALVARNHHEALRQLPSRPLSEVIGTEAGGVAAGEGHLSASPRVLGGLQYLAVPDRYRDGWSLVVLVFERGEAAHGEAHEWPPLVPVEPFALADHRPRDEADWVALSVLLTAGRPDLARHPQVPLERVLRRGAPGQPAPRLHPQTGWRVDAAKASGVLKLLTDNGRCLRAVPGGDGEDDRLETLVWNGDGGVSLCLRLERDDSGKDWRAVGAFRGAVSGRQIEVPLTEEHVLLDGGVLVFGGQAVRVAELPGLRSWLEALSRPGGLPVAAGEEDAFIERVMDLPSGPGVDVPAELGWREEPVPLTPALWVRAPIAEKPIGRHVRAAVRFGYDELPVHPLDPRDKVVDVSARRVVPRDLDRERELVARFQRLGFEPDPDERADEAGGYGVAGRLPLADLPQRLVQLLGEGWLVTAEDGPLHTPRQLSVSVASGIDWFELYGDATFSGGARAGLDAVIDAMRSGRRWVALDDGGFGLLPEAWLRRWRGVADLGEPTAEGARVGAAQIGLVDAAVSPPTEGEDAAETVRVDVDAAFERARDRLRGFAGVEPRPAPPGFRGDLRGYQQLALGWARLLEQLGFGGCLADDMGLGKTIQVLAILVSRKQRRPRSDPEAPVTSLVVVPRSLVFNWKQELARFAPSLSVVDHSGTDRAADGDGLGDVDVVLTTYGVLRRDVDWLSEVPFDYCVLDEAQAIKNPHSKAAKATRRLRARNRLALSGTPVENHLLELWSLFAFLNPGMLGSQQSFRRWMRRHEDETRARASLAALVRPFLLRRTKQEVAPELPPREDHRLLCPLGPRQRALYDRLREACRAEVMAQMEQQGVGQSNVQVLEALLRLRQAACHAALADPSLRRVPSAKLDMLLDKLKEVRAGGHKALVFSQFVKLLALVRERLDEAGVPYAYLDGRTRDRQAKVEQFQADPDCPLFLISLKAGGLGLNLTAAEYVFLLDPWWNPAVEAQAVDRTHRIGQDKPVFAYRLVAEDTIEQKMLRLQEQKRELADAVIQSDQGFLSRLTPDDLRHLFS